MHKALPRKLLPFFYGILKPYYPYIIGLVVIGVIQGLYVSMSPYVMKLIVNKTLEFKHHGSEIWLELGAYFCLYMGLWIVIAINFRVKDWINLKLHPHVRRDIIHRMFGYLNLHSHSYFQNNFAGSLANKIGDMSSSAASILARGADMFGQTCLILIAIVPMFMVNAMFGIILLVWMTMFSAISLYYMKGVQTRSHGFALSRTKLMGRMVDSVSNVTNMRLFSRNAYEEEHLNQSVQETVQQDRDLQHYILKMRIGWDISIVLLIGGMLASLIHLYSQHKVTIGDFTFIITVSVSIFHALWMLATLVVQFSEDVGKCSQALTIITEPHEIKDHPDAKTLEVNQGRIEFKDVMFYYQKNQTIFENKNVVIEPGTKVGLVGFSGSGKTTFVHLILRFFEVKSGHILIDGQDIADVTQNSLREQIAMIPQDTSLFHRTLMENIRYGNLQASDKEVIEASKQAYCHEFVTQLPDQYNALVGERGIKLSGGQRQRIAIARAMLKNAPILILDEATSALDSVTEKQIQQGLKKLMQGRTTIVIAHRLSTLAEMDRILVFDKGHIIEDGAHDELLSRDGHYAKMWHMQAGGFLPEEELYCF